MRSKLRLADRGLMGLIDRLIIRLKRPKTPIRKIGSPAPAPQRRRIVIGMAGDRDAEREQIQRDLEKIAGELNHGVRRS